MTIATPLTGCAPFRARPRRAVLGAAPGAVPGTVGAVRHFQIGPRIRVGGTLGKVGQKVKIGIGKVEKAAAPVAALIPGVGQIAAPILNTAGNLWDTSNGGTHLSTLPKLAIEDALLYGGAKAATGIESKLGMPGTPGSGGGSFVDWAKSLPGKLIHGGGTDGQGNMGYLGDLAGKYLGGGSGGQGGSGGGNDLLTKLLLGGSVAEGAMDEAKRRAIIEKAMNYATNAYDENAPLREQARSMLTNRSTPDLSSIFANPGNVYDTQRRATMTAPGMSPAPSGPTAAGAAGAPPPGGRMGLLRSYMAPV